MQRTVRGFSVSTRCETVEEFIATFRDRSDDKSIVVNVVEPRVVGTECAFAILLANKKPVLAGTCVVLDVYNDTNNVFKRRGMRLGINRLGVESERVFIELTAARVAAHRKTTELGVRALSRAPTMALPIVTTDVELGDAVLIAAAAPEAPIATMANGTPIAVPRRATQPMKSLSRVRLPSVQIPPKEKPRAAIVETRTPGSKYVLPANPLMDISDASLEGFVECSWGDASPGEPAEVPVPTRLARGTIDEPVNDIVEDGPTEPIEMPVRVARELRHDDLGALADDVTPLPPPPVVAAQHAVESPPAVEPPRVRRERRWMALAAIPAVAAVVAAIALANAKEPIPAAATRIEPVLATSAEEVTVRGTENIEAAPAAIVTPVKLAKRFPIVKRVKKQSRRFAKKPAGVMNLSDL